MAERFENRDMRAAAFRDVSLAGARFHGVNLSEVEFRNVTLAGASIRCARLAGLTIRDAMIEGMTIDGIDVNALVEQELDRRDPLRVELRPDDPHDPEQMRRIWKRLDLLWGQFLNTVQRAPVGVVTSRPDPDTWSSLEHIRHLICADEAYLHRLILADEKPLSDLGLLPEHDRGNPELANVGTNPSLDPTEVIAAWDRIHSECRDLLADAKRDDLARAPRRTAGPGWETVGEVLARLAEHELHHVRRAEALITASQAGDPTRRAQSPLEQRGRSQEEVPQ